MNTQAIFTFQHRLVQKTGHIQQVKSRSPCPTDDHLRTVPTNSKVFLCGLLNMREKQILTSITGIGIQKENWG